MPQFFAGLWKLSFRASKYQKIIFDATNIGRLFYVVVCLTVYIGQYFWHPCIQAMIVVSFDTHSLPSNNYGFMQTSNVYGICVWILFYVCKPIKQWYTLKNRCLHDAWSYFLPKSIETLRDAINLFFSVRCHNYSQACMGVSVCVCVNSHDHTCENIYVSQMSLVSIWALTSICSQVQIIIFTFLFKN